MVTLANKFARSRLNTFEHPLVEGKMMIHLKPITRKVIAGISTIAISAAGLMATAGSAQAADGQVTIDYSSSVRADYNYLAGSSTVDWAPWFDADAGLNAAGVDWHTDADWTAHNFKVVDGVLKVQKAQAGCDYAGIRVAALNANQSVVSDGHATVTIDATAVDAGVKYSAYATDSNDGNGISATATASGVSGTLTFTFTPATGVAYSKLWITPDSDLAAAGNSHADWGCGTASATVSKLYVFDNLSYYLTTQSAPEPRAANSTQLTFETGDALGAAAASQTFGGLNAAVVDAPAGWTGKVLSMNKTGEKWGGVNAILNSADRFTNDTYKTGELNFYSPLDADVPVVLELNPGAVQVSATAHKGWNKLSFDFSTNNAWSAATDYVTVALFPNFQADVVAEDTFYVDNISFNGATAETVEAQQPDGQVTVDYTSTTRADYSYLKGSSTVDWAPWGGGDAALNAPGVDWTTADPDWGTHNFKVADGVLKVQKAQAACDYAGIQIAVLAADKSVVSTGHKTVTVDVTAADAGVVYSAYATDSNDGNGITATATAASATGSLTFTFTPAVGVAYSKLWITPDSDLAIAGHDHADWGCGTYSATNSKLYTFDNLSYYVSAASAPQPRAANSTQLTFETGDALGAAAVSGAFEGAVTAIVDAPAGGAGTKALSIVKTTMAWGGVNILLHPNGTDKYTDSTHKVVTLNFYSPLDAAAPVVLELNPGAVQATATAHKGWQTLTFDFANTTAGSWSSAVDYINVALFPNFQVAANGNDTFYVDNISFNGASAPVLVQNPTVQAGAATTSSAISATKTLSFTVKDFSGAVVPNATVTFATNNKGTINHATVTANASGVATVVASATAAGSQVVVASYNDGNGGSGSASTTITWSVPKKAVAIAIKKRVVTVSVTNGKGSKVTVTANGGYKLTFTPTSWSKTSKTLTFKKAGTFTVKIVTAGATTVTKKYTVK
ncbi:MAG: hypothetical protein RL196_558 [Actinomycetota bacterium]|jgi:hypothetical protein